MVLPLAALLGLPPAPTEAAPPPPTLRDPGVTGLAEAADCRPPEAAAAAVASDDVEVADSSRLGLLGKSEALLREDKRWPLADGLLSAMMTTG